MSVKKMVSNQKGFTLVELMVVVAIIGILAAIAVPNFRKYQAKAKTGEATLALASLYTGEQSVMLATDTYVACVAALALERPLQGYYTVGFISTANTGKDPGKVPNCTINGTAQNASVKQGTPTVNDVGVAIAATDHVVIPQTLVVVGPNSVAGVATAAATATVNNATYGFTATNSFIYEGTTGTTACVSASNCGLFQAAAIGSISTATVTDVWTINQNKEIKIERQGY